ncbi:MAG: 5'/3'-nucleotidase SurE [Ardenticatenaceae bacterium]|nr:5'/3'-nucleotidase SurE [Ardenticatenaceae bacterium]
MHILITNDDGVTAPGLLILVQAMRQFGEVSVIAPDHDWSGHGHTKHFKRPLRVQEVRLADGTTALATDGSPADCVAMAVMGLLPQKVDLVVAGINSAANLGHDVSYSGTVAAIKEANIWGLAGVAISLDIQRNSQQAPNYGLAATVACQVVQMVIQNQFPNDVFFNVNVPDLPAERFRGIRLTRQGLRVYRDRLEKRRDPRGDSYYWIGGDMPSGIPKEGTDIGALALAFASVTPLKLDLTAYHVLSNFTDWGWTPAELPAANGTAVAPPIPVPA